MIAWKIILFSSQDAGMIYLSHLGYREGTLSDMNYIVIFKIKEETVYVLGIFHELEYYKNKL